MPLLFALALLAAPGDAFGPDVLAELSSPQQQVRDAAATRIRKTYRKPARDQWDAALKTIQEGETKQAIRERLKLKESEGGIGTGQSHLETFRLDDRWVLRAWFFNEGDRFRSGEIVEHVRHIWVAPPGNFTGTWVVYFANGQPSHVIEYRNGAYHGTFTSNHPNGTKSVVQHYGPEGADGEDTGYFPSGKVSYRALYRAGKAVGTWVWFNEDGTVRSTQVHPEQ